MCSTASGGTLTPLAINPHPPTLWCGIGMNWTAIAVVAAAKSTVVDPHVVVLMHLGMAVAVRSALRKRHHCHRERQRHCEDQHGNESIAYGGHHWLQLPPPLRSIVRSRAGRSITPPSGLAGLSSPMGWQAADKDGPRCQGERTEGPGRSPRWRYAARRRIERHEYRGEHAQCDTPAVRRNETFCFSLGRPSAVEWLARLDRLGTSFGQRADAHSLSRPERAASRSAE